MRTLIVAVVICAFSALAWSWPTVEQVKAEVQQGHTMQAERMIVEVVTAQPTRADTHYLYAEILAKNGKFAKGLEEAKTARELDPELRFTTPEQFRALEQSLEGKNSKAGQLSPLRSLFPLLFTTDSDGHGIPFWMWLTALAVVGFSMWRIVSSTIYVPARVVGLAVTMRSDAKVSGEHSTSPIR